MDLIDPHHAKEIFFDGVSDVQVAKGFARIVLFSRQDGKGVIEARLRCPLSELPDVIQALVMALTKAARRK